MRWLALALVLAFPLAHAQWEAKSGELAPIPPLRERVTDLTATLKPNEKQALEDKLAAWETKTGNQLAVLIVTSTQPEPIEAYSIRVAEAWKIGRKGKDNGALLVIAKNDRKLRIEVGYGFEGVLTDAMSQRIISETIAPLFRQNKFAEGIDAGVDQIIATIDKGIPAADVKPPPSKSFPRAIGHFPIEMLLIVVFVVVPILGGILRRMFGTALGSTVGAGIIGAGAWVVAGSLLIAIIAAIVALFVMLFTGFGGTGLSRRGGGVWIPSGGWGGGGGGWSGGSSGGGGFSGGGGSFGGGGASGSW